MKKIMIPILITVLFLASSIISVNAFSIDEGTLSNNKLLTLVQNSDQAELPVWSIGDFWEYDMYIAIIMPGCRLFIINVTRMDIVVTDDYGDEYILELSGYLDKFIFNHLEYSPDATYVSGTAYIDKSTLSMKSFELCLSGNSPNTNFDVVLYMGFDPELDFLEFPIALGEQWTISTDMDITIKGNIEFFGSNIPVEMGFLDLPLDETLSVKDIEEINVEAGVFESFKISGKLGDSSNLWYSSEIGYLTKVEITKELLGVNLSCNLELLSTNFNHPENNGAPDIPVISGPSNGQKGEEYEYIVSTTDPEGEDVYYKIDWGDGTCSDWLGPNASGEEVIAKHTWYKDATFNIRVKAKDINGYQTVWSDPTVVTMPVNYIGGVPGSQNQQVNLKQILLRMFPNII
jgi:hypothetical protein